MWRTRYHRSRQFNTSPVVRFAHLRVKNFRHARPGGVQMKNVFLVCFCAALIAACGEDGGDAGTNDQMSGGEGAPVMMGGETDDSSVMMGGEVDGGMAMMGDDAGETAPILTGDEPGWNATCAENTDCEAPVSLCSKQPGQAEGYCSTPCTTTADCPYEDWTCNVIGGCESPLATWCGPPAEAVDFAPVVSACD